MSKKSKTSKVAEKKVKAYELLRQIGDLNNQANVVRNELNNIEQEIAALEAADEHT